MVLVTFTLKGTSAETKVTRLSHVVAGETPIIKFKELIFWRNENILVQRHLVGARFLWFVSLSRDKEMNPRRAGGTAH